MVAFDSNRRALGRADQPPVVEILDILKMGGFVHANLISFSGGRGKKKKTPGRGPALGSGELLLLETRWLRSTRKLPRATHFELSTSSSAWASPLSSSLTNHEKP